MIHARDIAKVTKNGAAPFVPTDFHINLQCALDHRLDWWDHRLDW